MSPAVLLLYVLNTKITRALTAARDVLDLKEKDEAGGETERERDREREREREKRTQPSS